MNNCSTTVLLCWTTRNKRKERTTDILCKNYALKEIQSGCYVGKLKHHEQRELLHYFKTEFIKITEAYSVIPICKSCYSVSSLAEHENPQEEKKEFILF